MLTKLNSFTLANQHQKTIRVLRKIRLNKLLVLVECGTRSWQKMRLPRKSKKMARRRDIVARIEIKSRVHVTKYISSNLAVSVNPFDTFQKNCEEPIVGKGIHQMMFFVEKTNEFEVKIDQLC